MGKVPNPQWLLVVQDEHPDDPASGYDFGAFLDEEEARKCVAALEAEGWRYPLSINRVPLYKSADEWAADREANR